jgi:hypothetical protein
MAASPSEAQGARPWSIASIKLISVATLAALIWPVPAMLSHTSDDARVLGHYTLHYFAFSATYLAGVVIWAILTIWLIWRLTPPLLSRLRDHVRARWGKWLVGGFVLASVGMLGFRIAIHQTYVAWPDAYRQIGPELVYLLLCSWLTLTVGAETWQHVAWQIGTALAGTHARPHARPAPRRAVSPVLPLAALAGVLPPLLLTAYPVLFLYSVNLSELGPEDLTRPLIVTLAGTLVVLALLRLVFKEAARAVLTTSVIVIVFYAYGHVLQFLDDQFELELSGEILAGLSVVIVVGAFVLACRTEEVERLRQVNLVLAALASMLVVIVLIQIGLYRLSNPRTDPPPTFYFDVGEITVDSTEELPDIYYILLDGYSGNKTLLEQYGFDNSEFTSALEQRGFYVAKESRFTYCTTFLALPALLNMQHLDFLAENPGRSSDDPAIPRRVTDDNLVWRALKPLGYKFIHFRTHHGATRENRLADMDLAPGAPLTSGEGLRIYLSSLSEFEIALSRSTALNQIAKRALESNSRRETVLYIFETLEQIPEIEEPTFTLAHIASPHEPFVFDASEGPEAPGGTPVDGKVVDEGKYGPNAKEMSQFIYINRMTVQLVDRILAQSDSPPIIIIQADHGQRPVGADGGVFFREGPEYVGKYVYILSAFYVPEEVRQHLYPSITPVNTFRVIFDHQFGTHLGLLEDRSICFANRAKPYDFYDLDIDTE